MQFTGGGTYDTAIVSISSIGMYEVRASNGDTQLGGANFTNSLYDYCIDVLKKDGFDASKVEDGTLLYMACEDAKKELSTLVETDIKINWSGYNLSVKITRHQLETLIQEYVKKSLDIIDYMLKDANIEKCKIDDIVMVGGSTHMPVFKSALKEFFKMDPIQSIDPIYSGNLIQFCSMLFNFIIKSKRYYFSMKTRLQLKMSALE